MIINYDNIFAIVMTKLRKYNNRHKRHENLKRRGNQTIKIKARTTIDPDKPCEQETNVY